MVRDKANLARMERLLARWRKSGQSGRGFAHAQGVSPSKFFYWKRRLEKIQERNSREIMPKLLPVRVVSSEMDERSPGEIEVSLPSGERLVLGEGVTEEMLRRVVRVLRESC